MAMPDIKIVDADDVDIVLDKALHDRLSQLATKLTSDLGFPVSVPHVIGFLFKRMTVDVPKWEAEANKMLNDARTAALPAPDVTEAERTALQLRRHIAEIGRLSVAGSKIDAIKYVRTWTGLPLKDAKELVEDNFRDNTCPYARAPLMLP